MSKEKIFLSVIAVILGLIVAGGAFYIYQMTRTVNEPEKTQTRLTTNQPTSAPESSTFLIVNNPEDEEVFNKRVISVSGKTTPGSLIIVATESSDEVVKPTTNGDFTLTHTLEDGVNVLTVTAVFQNGTEKHVTKTVTSTTEEF